MENNAPNNWFEVVKEKIDKGAQSLNISSSTLTESAVALGFGFIIGYVAKKYGRQLLIAALLLIIFLSVLNYFSIIIIEWTRIKVLLGLSPNEDIHTALSHIGGWIKEHTLAVIVGAIAFLMGYYIG